jgi:hypothetical protein
VAYRSIIFIFAGFGQIRDLVLLFEHVQRGHVDVGEFVHTMSSHTQKRFSEVYEFDIPSPFLILHGLYELPHP